MTAPVKKTVAPRKRAPAKAAESPSIERATDAAKRLARSVNSRKGMAGTFVLASQMIPPPPRASTGSLSFDAALSGGLPVNQWTEIVGQENSGKTTFVLKTIATSQADDPDFVVVWVAAEAFDHGLAEACGVDMDRVWLVETNVMEEAYERVLEVLEERACSMVVIDSYPALVPTLEDAKTMDEMTMGGAKVTNLFFRKAGKAGKRSLLDPSDRPWIGVLINQWREKIGVQHGDPRTTPGGKGKNFAAYCRIDIKRTEWITDAQKNKVGQVVKIVVIKMKGAPGGQTADTDYYFRAGNGFEFGQYDTFKALLNLAEMLDVITRSNGNAGSFIDPFGNSYQGRQALTNAMSSNEELRQEVSRLTLERAKGAMPLEIVEEEQEVVEVVRPARRSVPARNRGAVPA